MSLQSPPCILIIEDEQHLADGLRFNLEAEGYAVETTTNGETALAMLLPAMDAEESDAAVDDFDAATNNSDAAPRRKRAPHFDAVVLDVMLPGADGFAVAAELRRRNQFVPVLMLTARGRPEDVLRGFEAGADDYLPKPFELKILLARLGALVRRRAWGTRDARQNPSEPQNPSDPSLAAPPAAAAITTITAPPASEVYRFGDKVFDYGALELRTPHRTVRLTLMEASLLRHLLHHAGRIVSRKQMLEDVWNLHEDTDTRAIDNFIVRLRRYIEADPARPRHLLTVRGVGYRFHIE